MTTKRTAVSYVIEPVLVRFFFFDNKTTCIVLIRFSGIFIEYLRLRTDIPVRVQIKH